ncbi:FHA domain-containing protein [Scytonema sp. UIC 10036]|uniref:FHA domain-containing protein n=1 Tax=Scytonema sp. UIC 10036 TaxID=2304196 RepID=UPI0012DAE578|nr:FHA domain-containing protein [Scytonema sp. UIC 10036]MUG98476.1 FHA domain-containing protein [Scytonema sp. UIC 10036]
MYQITFKWTDGTQNLSQTIASEQPTKVPGVIRIGRDPQQCDVVIQDSANRISRLHAEIFFNSHSNTFYLRNTTWNQEQPNVVLVDEKLVVEEEAPLQSGSVIRLREIPVTVVKLEVDRPPLIPHQEPPQKLQPQQSTPPKPIYNQSPQQFQPNQNIQPSYIPNQSPQPASKGEIKLGSILQRASQDDFDAITTMFRQFIPEDEQIYFARFLGIQGLWGFGTREFACVTDRRVADITVGRFGEVTYQDGYLEHINSGVIYQPSKLWLYLLIGMYLLFGWIYIFPTWYVILGLLDFLTFGLTAPLSVVLSLASLLLFLPIIIRLYYRQVKCGLVLSVREGELYPTPMGTYTVTYRLIYIFINRKLMTRANALYRSFIIQREARLDVVEKYPQPNQQEEQRSSQLTPVSLSSFPQTYADEKDDRTNFLIGVGAGAIALVGIVGIAILVRNLVLLPAAKAEQCKQLIAITEKANVRFASFRSDIRNATLESAVQELSNVADNLDGYVTEINLIKVEDEQLQRIQSQISSFYVNLNQVSNQLVDAFNRQDRVALREALRQLRASEILQEESANQVNPSINQLQTFCSSGNSDENLALQR